VPRSLTTALATLLLLAAFAPASASADPPPNDNRANAQAVTPPATVDGTTVEATQEENETSNCEGSTNSVWYRVTAPRDGRLIVELAANGDLDAVVDVFRVQRSRTTPEGCDSSDRRGRASVAVEVARNQSFLIRVAKLTSSVDDTFKLTIQFGRALAEAPGPRLPAAGATGSLQRVVDPNVAYSVRLQPGVTYKFNLASGSCTPLALYPPGTSSFGEASAVDNARCGGYMVFTPGPGQGGVYSLLAEASTARRSVRFRLMAARVGPDDTAPGRFIRNYARVRGSLDSTAIDVVDLYRFDVTRKSVLELSLQTEQNFRVTLVTGGGKRLASGDAVSRRVKPGRYFAIVRAGRRAAGAYRLTRVSRAITRTRALVEGRRSAVVSPGGTASLSAKVTPGVAGPVVIVVERFDPVDGWQFARQFRVRASGGTATVGFRGEVGRYRFRAEFRGTRGASPSKSGTAFFRIQGPLEE
jgi:hypothetical protein